MLWVQYQLIYSIALCSFRSFPSFLFIPLHSTSFFFSSFPVFFLSLSRGGGGTSSILCLHCTLHPHPPPSNLPSRRPTWPSWRYLRTDCISTVHHYRKTGPVHQGLVPFEPQVTLEAAGTVDHCMLNAALGSKPYHPSLEFDTYTSSCHYDDGNTSDDIATFQTPGRLQPFKRPRPLWDYSCLFVEEWLHLKKWPHLQEWLTAPSGVIDCTFRSDCTSRSDRTSRSDCASPWMTPFALETSSVCTVRRAMDMSSTSIPGRLSLCPR